VAKPRALPVGQLRLRENQLVLVLTMVVAVLAGLAAVLFTLTIDFASRLLFGLDPSALRLFLVPTLVSFVTGVLLVKVFPDVRGSGVPQTKAAFHLHGGMIPFRVPAGKFLMGVLAVGSGHSMGREGPSVQIGAGIASATARWMGLPPARMKDLLPVGVAGALAAAFNTPIAAVLFALEEIIGDMNAALLGSTVVASVTAVIVERSILGNEPLFHVPPYHLEHPAEIFAYVLLGIVGGLVSIVFCKGLLWTRTAFLSLPPRSRMLQPALGGAVIGVVLIFVPQVMGVGYAHVDQALNGGLPLKMLVLLSVAKLGATIVSYSSGNAGGIFAPSLYIGAMAGGAVGMLVNQFAPFATADPGAYALVGMGTLFAGIIRAPMTSVIMVFEITQDYQILVPLMVANLLSFWISRQYQPMPVYEALLRQDGVHLPSHVRPATGAWTAGDVMSAATLFVAPDRTAEEAARLLETTAAPACLVGDAGRLAGIVTAAQLEAALRDGNASAPVDSLIVPSAVHVHTDHPFELVVERFWQSPGMLPVVSRDDVAQVIGVVTHADITRFVSGPGVRKGPMG
jgi:CIC family chloride channel protein